MTQYRPMLAAAKLDMDIVARHLSEIGCLYMQPKIDGMRVCFHEGVARSRSWKPHSNKYLQAFAASYADRLQGFDGEVLSGLIYNPLVFRESMSGIRAEDGSKEFSIYLFDKFDSSIAYEYRRSLVEEVVESISPYHGVVYHHDGWTAKLIECPTIKVNSIKQIEELEEAFLADGWEGAILRHPWGQYKFGRSTPNQGALTKIKRFEDAEAIVIGYEPRYHNDNEKVTNELGLTSRSSHQDNLVAEECLGALHVTLTSNLKTTFKIGVFRNLTYEDKCALWAERDTLVGRIAKFKHQGYGGGYDAPRTPVWIGWRDPKDM